MEPLPTVYPGSIPIRTQVIMQIGHSCVCWNSCIVLWLLAVLPAPCSVGAPCLFCLLLCWKAVHFRYCVLTKYLSVCPLSPYPYLPES